MFSNAYIFRVKPLAILGLLLFLSMEVAGAQHDYESHGDTASCVFCVLSVDDVSAGDSMPAPPQTIDHRLLVIADSLPALSPRSSYFSRAPPVDLLI